MEPKQDFLWSMEELKNINYGEKKDVALFLQKRSLTSNYDFYKSNILTLCDHLIFGIKN
jgi:hypothetical protein